MEGRKPSGFTIIEDCPICGEKMNVANMPRHLLACVVWTDANLSDLRMHWADGTPVQVIAKVIGHEENSVWAMVHSLGLPSRKLNLMGEDGDKIAALYNGADHPSYPAISRALGISAQSGAGRIQAMLAYGILKPRGKR